MASATVHDASELALVPTAPPTTRSRRRPWMLLAGVIALVVAVSVAFAVFGGDAPDEVTIDDAVAGLDDRPGEVDEPDGAAVENGAEISGADGTWTVTTDIEPFDLATSSGSFVGYRIDEELANVGATQAVGRTPDVTGSLTVEGTTVTDLVVEGQLTSLASDRPRRDGRVADALQVDQHPVVRFSGETFELPSELGDGERIEVDVPGTLEAAGGSTEVVAAVTAERRGNAVVVTGTFDLLLADVGVTPPTAAVVLSVADTATVEWQLYLVRR